MATPGTFQLADFSIEAKVGVVDLELMMNDNKRARRVFLLSKVYQLSSGGTVESLDGGGTIVDCGSIVHTDID